MPHAEVLRRYLNLAVERPELLEPRFRASVAASTLATAVDGRPPEVIAPVANLNLTVTAYLPKPAR